jgi:hypothetical protein
MRSPCCLWCRGVSFWIAEPVFMKLVMYIVTPESISVAYFINPSHQSVCLYVYPLSLLGNGSVKTLPLQQIHTQQLKNCWRRRFLFGPYWVDLGSQSTRVEAGSNTSRDTLIMWFSGLINGAGPFEGILQKFARGVWWKPSVRRADGPDGIRNGYFTIRSLEH